MATIKTAEQRAARERHARNVGRLIDAAYEVSESFINTDATVSTYPAGLPSFDEFLGPLTDWRDAIDAELRRDQRPPVPFLTFSSADPTDVRCTCGNHPGSDGIYPCDARGVQVEPTAYAWPLALSVCARCGAVYHQPPTMNVYAGLTVHGEYPTPE